MRYDLRSTENDQTKHAVGSEIAGTAADIKPEGCLLLWSFHIVVFKVLFKSKLIQVVKFVSRLKVPLYSDQGSDASLF